MESSLYDVQLHYVDFLDNNISASANKILATAAGGGLAVKGSYGKNILVNRCQFRNKLMGVQRFRVQHLETTKHQMVLLLILGLLDVPDSCSQNILLRWLVILCSKSVQIVKETKNNQNPFTPIS